MESWRLVRLFGQRRVDCWRWAIPQGNSNLMPDYLAEATYAQTRLPVSLASTINPDAYRSAEFFELERDRLWAASWVAVGLTADLLDPGQVIVREVAGRSIILTHDREIGQLRAFFNVCRHRGSRLLLEDCTVQKRIRCPYHAWAYGLDGQCLGTPLFDGSEIPADQQGIFDVSEAKGFDKADYGLLPVRMETWGPLLFVNVSGDAPELSEYLGDITRRLAGYALESWKVRTRKNYDIAANWKLIQENFMEYYHLPWVHPDLAKVSKIEDHYRWQGPGMYCGMTTTPVSQGDGGEWLALPPYGGVEGSDLISGRHIALFPNVAMSVLPNHAFIMILNPVGHDRTIESTTILTHDDSMATDGAADALSELAAFWDEVNREDVHIVERVQQGVSTPEYEGGRMCYRFEEPVHRFQNAIIDKMVGIERIPGGDTEEQAPMFVRTDE